MHDGNCSNCNGGIPAQYSILALAGIVGAVDVAIIALRPHENNIELITLVDAVLAPIIAQMVGVNKTQELHKALCETAKVSNEKKEEIKQLLVQESVVNSEIKDIVTKTALGTKTTMDMRP